MKHEHRDPVYDLMRRQDSMATVRQLLAVGLSRREIHWAVEDEVLERIRHGIVGIYGVPLTDERRQRAAVMAAGPGAVLSYWAAGGRHDFPRVTSGGLIITVRRQRAARLEGVVCHTAPDLSDEDVVVIRGVPCTTMARTVVDLFPLLDSKTLHRILGHVERKQRPDGLERIAAAIERVGVKRRPEVLPLLDVLARVQAKPDGLDLTPRVLAGLRRLGVREPMVEVPVTWAGQDHVCDMLFMPEQVNLEMDDDWSHGTAVGSQADKDRDRRARRAGYEVLRATPSTDIDAFCQDVAWLLRAKRRAA